MAGLDNSMLLNMQSKNFLQEKGCQVSNNASVGHATNILCQDNASSIRLETDRKASSSELSCHINICHFLITGKIKNGEVSAMEHCPTEAMIVDHFAKPLQGSLFGKMRSLVMGCTEEQC